MQIVAIILVLGGLIGYVRSQGPVINDFTTNLENPPQFEAIVKLPENEGRDYSFPSKNIEIIQQISDRPKTLEIDGTLEAVFAKLEALSRAQADWELVRVDPIAGIIEAIATTSLMRFKDDVVIRANTTSLGKVQVDLRSKSRVGRSDLGANRKRIEKFIELMH